MSKNTFLKGLKYLNAFYNNFNFDINDDFKIGVWYKALEHLTDQAYTAIVKSYCKNNTFAPQSPTRLVQHATEMITQKMLTAEEAWEKTIAQLRNTGYDFQRVYKTCSTTTKETLKQMESELDGILTRNIPYAKKHFIEIYTREQKKHVEKNQLKLGGSHVRS